jgi:hypothetical protein
MSKEETPPIIRELHRYVFRGLGWVFLAGLLSSAISLLQRSCQEKRTSSRFP